MGLVMEHLIRISFYQVVQCQVIELFSWRKWRLLSAQLVSCCVYEVPNLCDNWADKSLHFLLLKSSMVKPVREWDVVSSNSTVSKWLGSNCCTHSAIVLRMGGKLSWNFHNHLFTKNASQKAVIAQWIRLCLPACGPGFESKHKIYAFLIFDWIVMRNWQ